MKEIDLLCNHLTVKQQLVLAAMLNNNRVANDLAMNAKDAVSYNLLGETIFRHAMQDDAEQAQSLAKEVVEIAARI